MPTTDSNYTVWALVASTLLGAAGWVTASFRDRRSTDSAIVSAAGDLVDRMSAEIERLNKRVEDLQSQVLECDRRHNEAMVLLAEMRGLT